MEPIPQVTVGFNDTFSGYRLSDGSVVNVRIMDTCGQEKYDSIYSSYYKDADCCLLVYDITSKKSFDILKTYYIKKLKENCKNIIKVVLLGNKSDLKDKRKVTTEEGMKLSQQNGYIFMESSCVTNQNVADAFTTLIEMTNRELIEKDIFKIKNSKTEKKVHKKKKFC